MDEKMLNRECVVNKIEELFRTTPGNCFEGITLFDPPVAGFGRADDNLFDEYTKNGVIGPWYRKPGQWLEGAETVISMFFPASKTVRASNEKADFVSSTEWAYARIEGQQFIADMTGALVKWLTDNSFSAVYPSGNPEFTKITAGKVDGPDTEHIKETDGHTFSSNWSERHAAYVCGLGTFGLSKGLITEKGIAGRFASVITDLYIKPDTRKYSGIYDYCIRCGKCALRCPAGAIDLINGKDHNKCACHVMKSKEILYPRYGCGLCQTGVPCEKGIPLKTE